MVIVAVCEHCGVPISPGQKAPAGVKLPCSRVYHVACLESLKRARSRARGLTAAQHERSHYTPELGDPCHPGHIFPCAAGRDGHAFDDPPPPYSPRADAGSSRPVATGVILASPQHRDALSQLRSSAERSESRSVYMCARLIVCPT
ncbi:hypothetical protein OBBRIDRAFT_790416 [Obba rivulosa]|uniref:Uncharacterized protein n=1 Tax=Obba rivulosa TaxID=1052685 RepID=A0A8E2DP90_9APHY|nr:hypothetical protein OBBRIDRAFT_790416 [Obba rivulosa]